MMCCSVRGGNTISIVQSLAVNGTAREISPLSPEEHLRTEHQRVFLVSARPQSFLNYLCHGDGAVCRTEGRGNETE